MDGDLSFFAPYEKAFNKVGGDLRRVLIHQGMPEENAVILWYSLPKSMASIGEFKVLVKGDILGTNRINHRFHALHRTGVIRIDGLTPGERYEVRVESDILPEGRDLVCYTKPQSRQQEFSFLVGSCLEPYDYLNKSGADISLRNQASLVNLSRRARMRDSEGGPAFYLGLGDQVYVDPGADKSAKIAYLYGGDSRCIRSTEPEVDGFLNELYRYYFGIPAWDQALAHVPSLMMWDDHDIRDGWGSQEDEELAGWDAYYKKSRNAFVAFQAARNPNFPEVINAAGWSPALPEANIPSTDRSDMRQQENLHVRFDWSYGSFFVVDGRSTKTNGPLLVKTVSSGEVPKLTPNDQGRAIEDWLSDESRKDQPTVFVFCYPVPVANNVGKPNAFLRLLPFGMSLKDDANDRVERWDREFLLRAFARHFTADNPKHRLLILAGDVHYSGVQTIKVDERVIGYQVISSGLAQTEFNTAGDFLTSVYGHVRDVSDPSLLEMNIRSQGMYSGPCFAELFLSDPMDDDPAPHIGLLFYPGQRVGKSRDEWVLDPSWLNSEEPPAIDSPLVYPESEGTGRSIKNKLHQNLQEFWIKKSLRGF